MKAAEREYFKAALDAAGGSAVELGARIGIARSTIFKWLKLYGLGSKSEGEVYAKYTNRKIINKGEKVFQ